MQQKTVLMLGEYADQDDLQKVTRESLMAAAKVRSEVINTRWMGPDQLALYPGMVAEASAIVLAPPPPKAGWNGLEPIVASLQIARTRKIPFLGFGRHHGLVFIEAGQNILGMMGAGAASASADVPDPVVAPLPENSSHLQPTSVELEIHGMLAKLYDAERITELSDMVEGLSPDYAQAISEAGFEPCAIERQSGRPYAHVLEGHPFHITTAFLPLPSEPGQAHVLFHALLEACHAGTQ